MSSELEGLVPVGRASRIAALLFLIIALAYALSPLLAAADSLLVRWDAAAAERQFIVASIADYRQFPTWNPFLCGGLSAWANIAEGPAAIWPWLPVYLLTDLPVAMRVEVFGLATLGLVGAWLCTGRVTDSVLARVVGTALVSLNGSFAASAVAGRFDALYGCMLPWIVYCFDVAWSSADSRPLTGRRAFIGAACCSSALIYCGGWEVFLEAALLVSAYAAALSWTSRNARALRLWAMVLAAALALAAPRLIPALLTGLGSMRVAPVDVLSLRGVLAAFVARGPVDVSLYGAAYWDWSEVSVYIGWLGLAVSLGAVVAARSGRSVALTLTALLAFAIGLGHAFEVAPWVLIHRVPFYAALHGSSRWFPAGLVFLGLAVTLALDRAIPRTGVLARNLAFVLSVALPIDLSISARQVVARAQAEHPPAPTASASFEQRRLSNGVDGSAFPCLSAVRSREGAIDCPVEGIHSGWAPRDADGRPFFGAASARGEPRYFGEAYAEQSSGHVDIVTWTPARVLLRTSEVARNDNLLLNQNAAPGWSVNGRAATSNAHVLAAPANSPTGEYVFEYAVPGLAWGLALLGLGVSALTRAGQLAIQRAVQELARVISRTAPPSAQWPRAALRFTRTVVGSVAHFITRIASSLTPDDGDVPASKSSSPRSGRGVAISLVVPLALAASISYELAGGRRLWENETQQLVAPVRVIDSQSNTAGRTTRAGTSEIVLKLPAGCTYAQLVLATWDSLIIGSGAVIRTAPEDDATIANLGAGRTEIGDHAVVPSIISASSISFGKGVLAGPRVASQAGIVGPSQWGTKSQSLGVTWPLNEVSVALDLPSPLDIALPHQGLHRRVESAERLAPGAYGDVSMRSGAVLELTHGAYLFQSLELTEASSLHVDNRDGPVMLYVLDHLEYAGTIKESVPQDFNVLLTYLGTEPPLIRGAFRGTLVAPHSTLHLPNVPEGHAGAFYARSIDVAPGTLIDHRPAFERTDPK